MTLNVVQDVVQCAAQVIHSILFDRHWLGCPPYLTIVQAVGLMDGEIVLSSIVCVPHDLKPPPTHLSAPLGAAQAAMKMLQGV
jgi:hypothetical protein